MLVKGKEITLTLTEEQPPLQQLHLPLMVELIWSQGFLVFPEEKYPKQEHSLPLKGADFEEPTVQVLRYSTQEIPLFLD